VAARGHRPRGRKAGTQIEKTPGGLDRRLVRGEDRRTHERNNHMIPQNKLMRIVCARCGIEQDREQFRATSKNIGRVCQTCRDRKANYSIADTLSVYCEPCMHVHAPRCKLGLYPKQMWTETETCQHWQPRRLRNETHN
jgi:hypothetical protein